MKPLETIQLIPKANQLTGFYIRHTLIINELFLIKVSMLVFFQDVNMFPQNGIKSAKDSNIGKSYCKSVQDGCKKRVIFSLCTSFFRMLFTIEVQLMLSFNKKSNFVDSETVSFQTVNQYNLFNGEPFLCLYYSTERK